MEANKVIKVLLVEDIDEQRNNFSLLFQLSGEIDCKSLSSAEGIVQHIKDFMPDVVLMDINLGGNNIAGIQAVEKIKKEVEFKDLLIIMHTVFDDKEKITKALQAGAKGYLLKIEKPIDVIRKLRSAVEHGGGEMSPDALKTIMDGLEDKGNKVASLTKEEFDTFQLLLGNDPIPEFDDKLNLSPDGVQYRKKSIFKKLDVHSRKELKEKYLDFKV